MTAQIVLSEVSKFSQLLPIVKKAESKLSLFGNRYICIGQEDIAFDLNELVSRTIKLLRENPHFSEAERPTVKQISKLINRLYQVSDEQIKSSNLFSWLANLFREFFKGIICRSNNYSNIHWVWKDCKKDHILPSCELYKYYTKVQFQKKFWYAPDKKNENLDFYDDSPDIWYRPRKNPSERRVVYCSVPSNENMWDDFSSTIAVKDPNRTKKSASFSLSKYVIRLLMME